MAISRNNTTITRVQYQGNYYRTVIRNGTTVFNLSNWTSVTPRSHNIFTQFVYNNCYNSANEVPFGQLSAFLGSNYPVSDYGANQVAMVDVYALIFNNFSFNCQFQFIRTEYYQIFQNA
jgi:hypothetical protein